MLKTYVAILTLLALFQIVFITNVLLHAASKRLKPTAMAQPGMGLLQGQARPLQNQAYLTTFTIIIVLAFKQLCSQYLPILHGPVLCCVSNLHDSRETERDPMCAHKMAVHVTKRPRLTLDNYFEKASGSDSEASTETSMGVYTCFLCKNEVPIVSELLSFKQEGENSTLVHPPPWWTRPLFGSWLRHWPGDFFFMCDIVLSASRQHIHMENL